MVFPTGIRTPIICSSDYRSSALPRSYTGCMVKLKKHRSFAKHIIREYQEKTTPWQIFMHCSLSSCRAHVRKWFAESPVIRFMSASSIWGGGKRKRIHCFFGWTFDLWVGPVLYIWSAWEWESWLFQKWIDSKNDLEAEQQLCAGLKGLQLTRSINNNSSRQRISVSV